MLKQKNIIVLLIFFTGIFLFKMPYENNICITPQIVYLLFSAGLLFYFCLAKVNKYIGFLFLIALLMTCRTYLGEKASKYYLFEDIILGSSMFATYYAIRILDIRENILKFFIFPALVNCGFVFIQKFMPGFLPFPEGIYGMLGVSGSTACFLGATIPIFYRYFKIGIIPVFLAILLCGGSVGLVAGIIGLLIMLFFDVKNKKKIIAISACVLIMAAFSSYKFKIINNFKTDFDQRMSMYIGTLDGIKYHPINGWGVGSFASIMASVKPENSKYFKGVPFNDGKYFMNHPHNESLYYWWSLGIFFMAGLCFLVKDYLKKLSFNNILPASILAAMCIIMSGYQLKPPIIFLMMSSMGIYENEYHNKEEICQ